MTRRPPSDIPSDHRHVPTRFLGVTEHGLEFELEVREVQRRANSNELVRAHIRSMTRGAPIRHDDLYHRETEIALFVRGRQRIDIRINPNNSYSIGHRTHRTLRDTVSEYLERFSPAPSSGLTP